MQTPLFRRRPLVEELEPRLLFSADFAPLALDALPPDSEQRSVDAAGEFSPAATQGQRHELLIVDAGVEDYSTLLNDILAQTDGNRSLTIVALDAARDGVEQITEILRQHSQLDALHLVSHGEPGALQLGNGVLDNAALRAQTETIAAWKAAFGDEADILLYGCDVASGSAGAEFVDTLSKLTGTDIAASTDKTGSAADSDWVLERQSGAIETRTLMSDAGPLAWTGTLAAGTEFQVNTTVAGDQNTDAFARGSQQAVAYDDSGNFVVVWTSESQDGSGDGVYARRFDHAGNALTGEIRVNVSTDSDQNQARVAVQADGSFVVTWTGKSTSSNEDVYWRRFDASGAPLTGEMRVNTTTVAIQRNSVIAMNAATGDYLIAWQGEGANGSQDIFFRRYAASGAALDAAERLVAGSADNETSPAAAMAANGNFVIAFESNNHIYFQRFDASGAARGTKTQGDSNVANVGEVAVAMDAVGNTTLVYRSEYTAAPGVWGREFSDQGTASAAFLIGLYGHNGSIAMRGDGSFVASYDVAGPDGLDIYARKYNADGSQNGGAFRVNQITAGDQAASSVAMRSLDDFVVVWSGDVANNEREVSARAFFSDNTAPIITSLGGGDAATVAVAENSYAVATMTASDAESQSLVYAIAGGADAGKFGIDAGTGALRFLTAPDYEAPTDANADNVYEVIVAVSDGSLGDTQTLNVAVTDIGGPLTVTTTADVLDGDTGSIESLLANKGADGFISLREAIIAANNAAGADTIVLGTGTYVLSRAGVNEDAAATGELDIRDILTLSGAGAAVTVIDGGGLDRVFDVAADLAMSGLTVRNGAISASAWGGGLYMDTTTVSLSRVVFENNTANAGGAIYNYKGTLVVADSTLRNNDAGTGSGGAVYNDAGTATFERVAIVANTAKDGGGFYNAGVGAALDLRNVTVSGNLASAQGGALHTSRTVSISSSTIAYNDASAAGGFHIQNPGSLTLENSIVAHNSNGNADATVVSLGYNIDSGTTLGLNQTGDQSNTDPLLDPLADNGGDSATHALRPGSPAINAAGSGAPGEDQRDTARDAQPDIGAYEYGLNGSPVAVGDAVALNEDSAAGVIDVLTNDSDPDGDALTASLVSGPTHGSLSLDTATGNFVYTPDPDWSGSDHFVYQVSDGVNVSNTATVALTVNPVNDAPAFSSTPMTSASEDAPYSATFVTTDAEGDARTISALSLPAWLTLTDHGDGTATLSGLPTQAEVGSHAIVIEVSDGSLASTQSFTLVVANSNDAPTSGDATFSVFEDVPHSGFLPAAGDDDGDTVSYALATPASHGSVIVHADGSYTYTPATDYSGSDAFAFTVSDGMGGSATYNAAIDIVPVNDAPTSSGLGNVATDEDAAPLTIDLFAAFADIEDADSLLSYALAANTHPALFSAIAIDNVAGTLTLHYAPDASGTADLTVRATDSGGLWVENTFTVTIAPQNDAPVLAAGAFVVGEGETVVLGAAQLHASDADNTASELRFVLTALPGAGILARDGSTLGLGDSFTQADLDAGRVTYTRVGGAAASDSFGVQLADSAGAATTGTVSVALTAPPAPPVAAPVPSDPAAKPAPDTPASSAEAPAEVPTAEPASPLVALASDNDNDESDDSGPLDGGDLFRVAYRQAAVLSPGLGAYGGYALKLDAAAEQTLFATLNQAFDALANDARALDMLRQNLGNGSFQQQLDRLQDDIQQRFSLDKNTVASALAVSTGLSVGYVLWLVRGGVLLSSLLSSLPAWRLIDPLPILGRLGNARDGDDEDDSLEGMLKKSADQPKPQPMDGPAA